MIIDELFFFNNGLLKDTVETVGHWANTKRRVAAATLDYSAMGKLMTVYDAIVSEYDPVLIDCYEAECRNHDEVVTATRTQIVEQATGRIVRSGLPELVPEDPSLPTYAYNPVCLECFEL